MDKALVALGNMENLAAWLRIELSVPESQRPDNMDETYLAAMERNLAILKAALLPQPEEKP